MPNMLKGMPSCFGTSTLWSESSIWKLRWCIRPTRHAWDILKDCPRWGTDADQQWGRLFQREAAQTNAGDEGVDEGVDEMTPSPSFDVG